MSEFVRVSEAAKRIGISRQRLYRLIKEGRIPSVSIAGLSHVDIHNLGNWRKGEDLRKLQVKRISHEPRKLGVKSIDK